MTLVQFVCTQFRGLSVRMYYCEVGKPPLLDCWIKDLDYVEGTREQYWAMNKPGDTQFVLEGALFRLPDGPPQGAHYHLDDVKWERD